MSQRSSGYGGERDGGQDAPRSLSPAVSRLGDGLRQTCPSGPEHHPPTPFWKGNRVSTTPAKLDWTELDDKAVDTVRVLAMDAVQKVGNGHPGTAMSLAPGGVPAVPEGDAAQPGRPPLARPRPLRPLLRALEPDPLHPALPRRLGPRARRPRRRCAPGAARRPATRSTATPPASRPRPARSARASATRSAWRWPPAASTACSTRTSALGDSPFDHHDLRAVLRRRHRGGRLGRGLRDRRRPAARQPHPDLRRQPDLDRGQHRHRARPRTSARATRPTAGTSSTSTGPTTARRTRRTCPALYDAIRKAEAVTDKPSFIVLHTIIAWPAPNAQNTGKAHGSALGADEVAATKKVLGFDPEQTFEVPTGVLEHTRQAVDARQGRPGRRGTTRSPRGRRSRPPTPPSSSGSRPAPCPRAGPTTCRRSTPTRRASRPASPPAP